MGSDMCNQPSMFDRCTTVSSLFLEILQSRRPTWNVAIQENLPCFCVEMFFTVARDCICFRHLEWLNLASYEAGHHLC